MFDELASKLDGALKKMRQRGVLTEPMIKEGLREVRRVLLEADVNFKVTRDFLGRVQERGHEVGARSLHERYEGRAREHAGRIFVETGSRHLGLRLYLLFHEHSCLKRLSHCSTRYKHPSDLNYLTGT